METVKFLHSVNAGDCLSIMAGLQHLYQNTGKKSILYQRLNMPGNYFGQDHPLKKDGVMVTMTEKQFELLKPLVEAQEYIHSFEIFEGQKYDYSFDKMREGNPCNIPYGIISRWAFLTLPALSCDTSKPWIKTTEIPFENKYKGWTVVNFTSRYRNHLISYYTLKQYDNIIFSGTKGEHEVFCKENNLDIPYLEINNFLELAIVLKESKFVLCNQSMIWNICDAGKFPRLLELSPHAPNCFPQGENGWEFINQSSLEFYLDRLMNNKKI
jgi:hypothetical protein